MKILLHKYIAIPLVLVLASAIALPILFHSTRIPETHQPVNIVVSPSPSSSPLVLPTPTSTPVATAAAKTASASAKVSDLSFADASKLYGPCTVVPTLMYHHIEDLGQAQTEGHKALTVDPKYFRNQMQYLKDHQYMVIRMQDLVDFFNTGKSLSHKSILLTFDDGYEDFYSVAVPILNQFQYPSTMFTPTGLIENPNYLTWSQIQNIASSGRVLFSNHTWSHRSMNAAQSVVEKEITTAETQLHDHGYDSPKVFAYPYGESNPFAVSFLGTQGYQLAFTTKRGATLCKGQKLSLPRIRIGNAQLNFYGL